MVPMTQITSDLVEACRRVPIHRVVGLTNISKRAKIKCPFHGEKTASCVLFPTGGFKCFGCGAGGNSVDFIMKLGESFDSALQELKKHI